jgi:hypothetical protein
MFHLTPEVDIDIGGVLAPLFGTLIFTVVSWRSVRMAWISTRLLVAWRDLWIAVTPGGIVDYRGARLGIGHAFDFADTIKIEKTSRYPPRFLSDFALTFWRARPSQPQRRLASGWFINPCYQHRDQIAQLAMLTQRAYRAQAARSPWDAEHSPEPRDTRSRMIWNTAGWSCGMLVCGCALFLLTLGILGLILLTTFGSRKDGGFWIVVGLLVFSLIGALVCWLIAWRKSDWKIPMTV